MSRRDDIFLNSMVDSGCLIDSNCYDDLTFIQRRKAFLDSMMRFCNYDIRWSKIVTPITQKKARGFAEYLSTKRKHTKEEIILLNSKKTSDEEKKKLLSKIEGFWNVEYVPELQLYTLEEEEGEFVLSEQETYSGLNFNKNWNTRDLFLSEFCLEFDGDDFKQNLEAFYSACIELVKLKIHYCTFYAEGQRSPHIRAYDLFSEIDDWDIKARVGLIMAKQITPLEYHHLIDVAVLGKHTIQLEFSKHYKTGKMFKLMFENIPEVSKCN